MIHDGMLYNPIQGHGHGDPKVAKMADFKSVSFASMHVIKTLMVNYDTPRQYLIFFRPISDNLPRSASHDLQN